MQNSAFESRNIPAAVDLDPESVSAASAAARASGRSVSRFISDAIQLAASVEIEEGLEAPWGKHSMELFADALEFGEDALRGRWVELAFLVKDDNSLWTVRKAEGDLIIDQYDELLLDRERLAMRWAELVARVFLARGFTRDEVDSCDNLGR